MHSSTSALDVQKWSQFHPLALLRAGKIVPGTHWIRVCGSRGVGGFWNVSERCADNLATALTELELVQGTRVGQTLQR